MTEIRIKAAKTCSLIPLAALLLLLLPHITHCTIFILIYFDHLLSVQSDIRPLNRKLLKNVNIH